MSILQLHSMTNHHPFVDFQRIAATLETWKRRYEQRRELAQWSDLDLSDIGQSRSSIADEVNKPFWRS